MSAPNKRGSQNFPFQVQLLLCLGHQGPDTAGSGLTDSLDMVELTSRRALSTCGRLRRFNQRLSCSSQAPMLARAVSFSLSTP